MDPIKKESHFCPFTTATFLRRPAPRLVVLAGVSLAAVPPGAPVVPGPRGAVGGPAAAAAAAPPTATPILREPPQHVRLPLKVREREVREQEPAAATTAAVVRRDGQRDGGGGACVR
jgi:hypothetical protein